MESAERYFLKYAFPCAYVLVQQGKITKEKQENLERKLFNGESIDRTELEEIFVAAFRRIKKLASEMKKDHWDLSVIKYYFIEYHNKCIDEGEGDYAKFPDSFREICKVHKAEVVEKEKEILKVKYGCFERKVIGKLIPDVQVGDKVYVHLGFAIEKIE